MNIGEVLEAVERTKAALEDQVRSWGYTVPLVEEQRRFAEGGPHPVHGPLAWIGGPFVLGTMYGLAWQDHGPEDPPGDHWHLFVSIGMAKPGHTKKSPNAVYTGMVAASFRSKDEAVAAFESAVQAVGLVEPVQLSLF